MSDINALDGRMRMLGLASGMDTEAMIKKMMAAESMKVDKMKQNRQYVQWRQDIYRDIIKDFRDLRSSFLMINSPEETNLMKNSSYTGSKIVSSDANTVTATALPGVSNGVNSIVVNKIASSAKAPALDISKNSADVLYSGTDFNNDDWNGKTLTFNINGKVYTTSALSNNTKENLANAINTAINATDGLQGKVTASLDGNGKIMLNSSTDTNIKVTLSSTALSKTMVINPSSSTILSDLGVKDGTFDITLPSGTAHIKVDSTKTIQDLINTINNTPIGNSKDNTLYSKIKVNFSDLTHSLNIETRDTGLGQKLTIGNDNGVGISNLGLVKIGLDKSESTGSDAEAIINGNKIIKSTNTFIVDNVAYNLIKKSALDGTEPIPTTLTITADAKDSFKKIKDFIDKYNTLVQKISDKIQEKKEYSYKPLTDDQKKDMKDDQIKAWEEKAKQGILKNDGDLQKVLFDMRSAFTSGVKAAGISLKEIGIDTYGSFEAATKPGQLKIDEAKLKSALETRGDQVMQIFISSAPSTMSTEVQDEYKSKYGDKWQNHYEFDNSGIFQRISSIINDSAVKFDGTLLKKAGYKGTLSEFDNTITKQLKDQDKSINEMNKKLATKQEHYYQMFARLETAMNQMNAQQSWLTQQLGGGR